jgi:hypothetical protein
METHMMTDKTEPLPTMAARRKPQETPGNEAQTKRRCARESRACIKTAGLWTTGRREELYREAHGDERRNMHSADL